MEGSLQLHGSTMDLVLGGLSRSKAWNLRNTVCFVPFALFTYLSLIIYVISSGAEQSLVEATAQRWRRCDRYSTFHGAFVGLLSNNEIKIDYLGADLGDEEESGDDLPVSPPTPMLTPGKQGHRSPAIPPEGSAISSTPRPVNHPLVLSSHGKPRTFGKSSSLCSPSEDKPSSGINVQISPKVDIRLRSEYVLVSSNVGLTVTYDILSVHAFARCRFVSGQVRCH
jgi:hypothetical protein